MSFRPTNNVEKVIPDSISNFVFERTRAPRIRPTNPTPLAVELTRSSNKQTDETPGSHSTRQQEGAGKSFYRSFSGGTLILMGDGTKKPSREVEVGDYVIATNPLTGDQQRRRVTHLWVREDTLVDLQIDGETITTTEDRRRLTRFSGHGWWWVRCQAMVSAPASNPALSEFFA